MFTIEVLIGGNWVRYALRFRSYETAWQWAVHNVRTRARVVRF